MKQYELNKIEWKTIHDAIKKIENVLIDNKFKPDLIVGISRGGLIPAIMLSHKLKCRKFGILKIKRSKSDEMGQIFEENSGIFEGSLLPLNAKNILLIDDIVAYGKTIDIAKKKVKEIYKDANLFTISLFVNVERLNEIDKTPDAFVDFFYEKTIKEEWISFPWESYE